MAYLSEVYGPTFIKPQNNIHHTKKCTQCSSALIPITNDGGTTSLCQKCNKYYDFTVKYCKLCMLPEHNHNAKHQFTW